MGLGSVGSGSGYRECGLGELRTQPLPRATEALKEAVLCLVLVLCLCLEPRTLPDRLTGDSSQLVHLLCLTPPASLLQPRCGALVAVHRLQQLFAHRSCSV